METCKLTTIRVPFAGMIAIADGKASAATCK